jgi:hypothetical protein
MKTITLLISFLSLFISLLAHADLGLTQEFKQTYSSHYVASKCGDNILGLIGRADRKGINMSDAQIIEIENKGLSVFGMVNAEYVRGIRTDGKPSETNWFHHVILEKDGLIYDFDFSNIPEVLSVKEYFEKMFLKEKTRAQGGDQYVGREEKLKNYRITIKPALETYQARQNRQLSPEGETLSLGQYLNQY